MVALRLLACLCLIAAGGCAQNRQHPPDPVDPVGDPGAARVVDAPARPSRPSVDQAGAVQMLRWCSFHEDQAQNLLTASERALLGEKSSDQELTDRLMSAEQLRDELHAHPACLRDCVLCQTLTVCASVFRLDELAHLYQAHNLAQTALALAGYSGDEEVPVELRDQVPAEGGADPGPPVGDSPPGLRGDASGDGRTASPRVPASL
jgi:hypothetical protein